MIRYFSARERHNKRNMDGSEQARNERTWARSKSLALILTGVFLLLICEQKMDASLGAKTRTKISTASEAAAGAAAAVAITVNDFYRFSLSSL